MFLIKRNDVSCRCSTGVELALLLLHTFEFCSQITVRVAAENSIPIGIMATKIAEARRKANLRVLQRLDSLILDIQGSATHVVLYEFSVDSQQWEKTGCEGSLFIAKRSESPRFKLVVLNRNSKENLEVPITGKFQMQVQDPYLIFRETKGDGVVQIRGIWFHDNAEREAVSGLLTRIVSSMEQIEQLEEKHSHDAEALGVRQQQQQQSGGTTNQQVAAAGAAMQGLSVSAAAATGAPTDESADGTKQSHRHHHHASNNLVLDKKSLQLSLLSLIQDERFLDLIHAQYLKVAQARANREKHGDGGGH